jgi:signal transduction histidine kinase
VEDPAVAARRRVATGRSLPVVKSVLGDLLRVVAGPDYPPPGPRRLIGWRALVPPVVVFAAIGFAASAAAYLADNRDIPGATRLLIAVLSVLPPALAWWRPLWAWRLAYVALFVGVIGYRVAEPWPWNPVQIFGTYAVLALVAVRASVGVSAWVALLTLLPVWLFAPEQARAWGVTVSVAAVVLIGDQVRRRRRAQRALAEQEELSELEKARRAVLEERTRIARELHDVIAHHMSMIAVRAETAPFRVAALPDPARSEFTEIAQAARGALTEMRRLLGVLRSDAATPELAPQPGLPEIADLVTRTRDSGMRVDLRMGDAAAAPPDGVALAAYRIVQEALANAARHAPGAAVEVALRPGRDDLGVRVTNGAPPGGPARPGTGGPGTGGPGAGGHGLAGMRERVAAVGGDLTAGPTAGGGYEVIADLPYRTEPDPK